MLDKIGIFLIFLTPLVFFHELGHFFFAKLFGVRVETFSIGFGPKLFKWTFRGTEFAFSAIPLGGYVKMFGDDPLSEEVMSEEDRQFSFVGKGKWARFCIVFGGPLANFILAFVLFYGLAVFGERVPLMSFGQVPKESVFYQKGIRNKDKITHINMKSVVSPGFDLGDIDTIQSITVRGLKDGGVPRTILLNLSHNDFLEKFAVVSAAGLTKPVFVDLQGRRFKVSKINDVSATANISQEELTTFFKDSSGPTKIVLSSEDGKKQRLFQIQDTDQFMKVLMEGGFFPLDLVVKDVVTGSPAKKAGLRPGDIIVELGDDRVYSFETLKSNLQKFENKEIRIYFYRLGQLENYLIAPELEENEAQKIYRLGIFSSGEFFPPQFQNTIGPGVWASIPLAWKSFWSTCGQIMAGFKKLIFQEVSLKNVGGPVAIGQVASKTFEIGNSVFLKLMAIVSINLGIINLFPIPVLDGGHIFFILLECLNKGPLSRRKLEIAQRFGLVCLLTLMILALYNDFSRLLGL